MLRKPDFNIIKKNKAEVDERANKTFVYTTEEGDYFMLIGNEVRYYENSSWFYYEAYRNIVRPGGNLSNRLDRDFMVERMIDANPETRSYSNVTGSIGVIVSRFDEAIPSVWSFHGKERYYLTPFSWCDENLIVNFNQCATEVIRSMAKKKIRGGKPNVFVEFERYTAKRNRAIKMGDYEAYAAPFASDYIFDDYDYI